MNKVGFLCFALALSICLQPAVPAQNSTEFLKKLERYIGDKEPDWKMERQRRDEGIPGPNMPHGVRRHYHLTSGGRTVWVYIFFGATRQGAVRELEQSQRMLSINASRPVKGLGEEAYQYAKHGGSWLTFRKSNVMAKVSIYLVDWRTVDIHTANLEAETREALEIARKFAKHIARVIPSY